MASVEELAVATAADGTRIRSFSMQLNGVQVSVCSVGASILELKVPNYLDPSLPADDVVLGYKTAADLYDSRNPPYFAVVVGRVANRIAKGNLTTDNKAFHKLAINNDPNHLHGGVEGFSSKIWDAETVEGPTKGVKFTLVSKDGDQGYPGSIKVSATYTLIASDSGVSLCLQMEGSLLDDKMTPLSLAQHSYFNLAGHDCGVGVLDHKLTMPSLAYTPIDATLIPTREVKKLEDDPIMDWRGGRIVRDALQEFAKGKAGLTAKEAKAHVEAESRTGSNMAKSGASSATPGEPYGFDHNYVVNKTGEGLSVAGIVEHEATKRRMIVSTDAPGVQLYTANYLDGSNAEVHKKGIGYGQWQALCLETQTFPDSILVNALEHPEFAKGKTKVLTPGGDDYSHRVEYKFEGM